VVIGRCAVALEVPERRPKALAEFTVKKKLAPKACAERIRLPAFRGLEIRSAPMAKYPRISSKL
jgi:hypothetical protein